MFPSLAVQIVAWNSMGHLPALLETLFAQTFTDFHVLVVDNGSDDGVDAFVRAHYPTVALIRNAHNRGFAAGHNQGIRYALDRWGDELEEKFILVLNPDILLEPTCFEELLRAAMNDPHAGAFGPKLLRAFTQRLEEQGIEETTKSDVLDTTGIRAKKNRTFVDRGAGEIDAGQYDGETRIFGPSGALAMYRANALAEAVFDQEYFDPDFFTYKEDVDLAWRLNHLGWYSVFVPSARAHHFRAMRADEQLTVGERMANRRSKSRVRSYYSNRNHWLLLMKNERMLNAMLALPRIAAMELARVVYTAFYETKNLAAFLEALAKAPRMRAKRKRVLREARVQAKDMRKLFS